MGAIISTIRMYITAMLFLQLFVINFVDFLFPVAQYLLTHVKAV